MKKVIAVFGSPHSGKSVVSLALAAALAARKQDVIVLSGDKVTPMLHVYAPKADTPQTLSVGGLLMDEVTEKAVTERILFQPKSDYMGYMAMATGDNITTYPPRFSDEKTMALFNILYRLTDYLIVDCTSNPMSDSITLKALEIAHVVIRLTTPDMMGLEYWRSMMGLLRDERFKNGKQVPVISNARPISPVREVKQMYKSLLGDIHYTLPYSHEVEDRLMSGRQIKWLGRKDGIVFENEIERLCKKEVLSHG